MGKTEISVMSKAESAALSANFSDNAVFNLMNSNGYCSLPADTEEGKKFIYNISQNPDYQLNDFIGKKIEMTGIYSTPVNFEKLDEKTNEPIVNAETGEVETVEGHRTILIDSDGESYACAANGVFDSLKKILWLYGEPHTWKKPIPIEIKNITTKKGRKTMTIVLL